MKNIKMLKQQAMNRLEENRQKLVNEQERLVASDR